MNAGLQNRLSEVVGANNIAYILQDNNDFSVTGYKVMQNQNGSGLLKCAKLMYNGKIKLVYIVENYKPLSYVATRLGVTELNAVVFNLIQRAMEIKANGFFRAENLELNFDKIFVDVTDYSVHLIYFPISGGNTGKISGFENEFRVALINLFNSFPVFNAPQFQRLCSDLSNGSLPLEQVLKKLQDNINGNYHTPMSQPVGNMQNPVYQQQGYQNLGNQSNYQNQGYQNLGNQSNYQNQGYQNLGNQPNYQNQAYQQGFSGVYENPQPMSQPVMTITAINSPVQMALSISIPEYLIGKNPEMVNGAVTHNPAISRVHCKVTYSAGRYYLTDLGSANGTYVNQQRLEKQQTVELHSGDYLKLANSDFIVAF